MDKTVTIANESLTVVKILLLLFMLLLNYDTREGRKARITMSYARTALEGRGERN